MSWCRGVPEPWLGVLADACTSLRKLTVFGCSQVTSPAHKCSIAELRSVLLLLCCRSLLHDVAIMLTHH